MTDTTDLEQRLLRAEQAASTYHAWLRILLNEACCQDVVPAGEVVTGLAGTEAVERLIDQPWREAFPLPVAPGPWQPPDIGGHTEQATQRRAEVEAWCERANEQMRRAQGIASVACAHVGPCNEWSDRSRWVCGRCGEFVPGAAADYKATPAADAAGGAIGDALDREERGEPDASKEVDRILDAHAPVIVPAVPVSAFAINLGRSLAAAVRVTATAVHLAERFENGGPMPYPTQPMIDAVSVFGGGGPDGVDLASGHLVELQGLVEQWTSLVTALRPLVEAECAGALEHTWSQDSQAETHGHVAVMAGFRALEWFVGLEPEPPAFAPPPPIPPEWVAAMDRRRAEVQAHLDALAGADYEGPGPLTRAVLAESDRPAPQSDRLHAERHIPTLPPLKRKSEPTIPLSMFRPIAPRPANRPTSKQASPDAEAWTNIGAFEQALNLAGLVVERDTTADGGDEQGYPLLGFRLRCGPWAVDVSVPNCQLDVLKAEGPGQPRMYVRGGSFWWKYAVEVAREALTGGEG